jgi:hypothetical protein
VTELTHQDLDALLAAHARGAVGEVMTWFPRLAEIVRGVLPGETLLEVRVPQVLGVNQNARGHWQTKGRLIKEARAAVSLVLSQHRPPPLPLTVVMVRCAPRLCDDDNAVASCKQTRDAVADWLGIDDRDPRVAWKVEQSKVPRKEQGTVIRVEARRA